MTSDSLAAGCSLPWALLAPLALLIPFPAPMQVATASGDKRAAARNDIKRRRDTLRSRLANSRSGVSIPSQPPRHMTGWKPMEVRRFVTRLGRDVSWKELAENLYHMKVDGKQLVALSEERLIEAGVLPKQAALLVRSVATEAGLGTRRRSRAQTDSSDLEESKRAATRPSLARLSRRLRPARRLSNSSFSAHSQSRNLSSQPDNEHSLLAVVSDPRHSVWRPVETATDLLINSEKLQRGLPKGFGSATEVQRWTWGIAPSGRDMIATAPTGSGKTIAFLIPLLLRLLESKNAVSLRFEKNVKKMKGKSLMRMFEGGGLCRPQGLIVLPTRELAIQVYEVAQKLFEPFEKIVGILFGGSGLRRQATSLSMGVDALVTTPGRALDVIKNATAWCTLDLAPACSYVVLDEADRLLSMGFQEEVTELLSLVRRDRQSLLFSATWPINLDEFSKRVLSNPVRVSITEYRARHLPEPAKRIEQIVRVCSPSSRAMLLLEVLKEIKGENYKRGGGRTLIFTLTKKSAEYVRQLLQITGYEHVREMHGDLSQEQRVAALYGFRNDPQGILVATDVAARGLDIPDVGVVINYEMPQGIDHYVHRIGRTGRAGRRGVAFSLFTKNDMMLSEKFIQVLRGSKAFVPPELMEICAESRQQRKDRNRRLREKKKAKVLQIATSGVLASE